MSKANESGDRKAGMRRGSVMMEFIIVFPIYLILFASTFILGDMLVHSNRLAFGDVVNAFVGVAAIGGDHAAAAEMSRFYRSEALRADNGQIERVIPSGGRFMADADGSWTECAASTFGVTYKPSVGGMLGQLLAGEALVGGTPQRADNARTAVDDWRDGGFTGMKSKGGNILFESVFKGDNDTRSHCFYVLRRNRSGNYDTGAWRHLSSGLLIGNRWRDKVLDDGWHSGETLTKMQVNDGGDGGARNFVGTYSRYDRFVEISD